MFHRPPIEQGRETRGIVESAGGTAVRGCQDRRLQVPENARSLSLPQGQETLAGGNEARERLMEIGEYRAGFVESEDSGGKAKGGAVMNLAALPWRREASGFQREAKKWEIAESDDGLEKIPSERGTADAAFSRGFLCAQTVIELQPLVGVEICIAIACQPERFAAKYCFQQAGFF